jgi:phosphoribosylamine--glycine ligase/phosphoribosylformylglycinamidine cyclo-ligase
MADLRILLIGNGGREHALAWKLSQSSRVEQIYAVPGNGGTAGCPKTSNVTSVKAEDFAGLVKFSQENGVNLVVPGPEAPLVDGVDGSERQAFPASAPPRRLRASRVARPTPRIS